MSEFEGFRKEFAKAGITREVVLDELGAVGQLMLCLASIGAGAALTFAAFQKMHAHDAPVHIAAPVTLSAPASQR